MYLRGLHWFAFFVRPDSWICQKTRNTLLTEPICEDILSNYKLTASREKSSKNNSYRQNFTHKVKISRMKRFGLGLFTVIAWLSLFVAILGTSVSLAVGQINSAGTIASKTLETLSTDTKTVDDLIDEISKDADPATAKAISENRKEINKTIKSLSASPEFRESLKSALDQLSAGVIAGKQSVNVDFSALARLAANQINSAAKAELVSKKDLASFKPVKMDIHKASNTVSDVKKYAHLSMLFWVAWVLLLLICWRIGSKNIRLKGGRQLLSVGVVVLLIKIIGQGVGLKLVADQDVSVFVSDQISTISSALLGPVQMTGITCGVIGASLMLVPRVIEMKRKRFS